MTRLPSGSRKLMLSYLPLEQFCKEQKAGQCPSHAIATSAARYVNLTFQKRNYIKHSILHSGKINTVFNSLLLDLTLGTMKPCSLLSTKATGTNHLTVITHLHPDKSSGKLQGYGSDGICCCRVTQPARVLPHARPFVPAPAGLLRLLIFPQTPHCLQWESRTPSDGRMHPVIKTANLQ